MAEGKRRAADAPGQAESQKLPGSKLTFQIFEELFAAGRDDIAKHVQSKDEIDYLLGEINTIVKSGKLPEQLSYGLVKLLFAARGGSEATFHLVDADTLRQHRAEATKPKKQTKTVPPTAFKNQQIDLFRDLLANTDKEREGLSNAIDLWDNVPRYALSRAKQEKSRLEGGFLPLAELDFQYKGNPYTAQIRPARIELKNKDGELTGETAEFYPSAREELVEHALRKLATEQQLGFLDTTDSRSGVTFTLHQLRTELADHGRWLKYAELVESLDIMNLSNIRLIDKGTNKKDPSLMSQPYLPTLIKVSKEGLASDPGAKWLVQFHSTLTESITQLTYRQFNYQRMMKCQSQIARWLISQLVLKYTYAAPGNTFSMLYSTIKRDSGLLDNYSRARAGIEALDEALDELKREGVLMSFKKDVRIGARGKIEDISYELATSVKFAAEQKAANKRLSTSSATLDAVDNSK